MTAKKSKEEPNPVGRPPKYKTPEEMQAVIDEYFIGITYTNPETGQDVCRPTMSGIAFALDMSRQAMCDYAEKGEFLDTIKRARQRVEMALEANLYNNSVTGTIFNLKNNFAWKDKVEKAVSGAIGVVDLSGKTDEELKAIINGS